MKRTATNGPGLATVAEASTDCGATEAAERESRRLGELSRRFPEINQRQLPIVPPLPSMRDVATALREARPNAPAEGWNVALTVDQDGWRLTADETELPRFGGEHVPFRTVPRFDAVRAARRLLFAADDALNPRVFS